MNSTDAGPLGAGDRPARPCGRGAGRIGAGGRVEPEPDEVRKALLASLGGRGGWTPPPPSPAR